MSLVPSSEHNPQLRCEYLTTTVIFHQEAAWEPFLEGWG